MTTIAAVHARQVWDSRGRPTVEAEVTLASGARGRAIAPSGASTGKREALDLRDGGERLGGFGVNRALAGIAEVIAPALIGMDAASQAAIDAALNRLDGTPQKTRLGGNAIVAVSMAVAWAGCVVCAEVVTSGSWWMGCAMAFGSPRRHSGAGRKPVALNADAAKAPDPGLTSLRLLRSASLG